MEKLKPYYKFLISVLPLLAMAGTFTLWVDTRYLHKQIADTRYIDVQLKITQSSVRAYNKLKSAGLNSASDDSQNQLDMQELTYLSRERNKVLGIQ